MLGRSVNLTALSWAGLNLLSSLPVLSAHPFASRRALCFAPDCPSVHTSICLSIHLSVRLQILVNATPPTPLDRLSRNLLTVLALVCSCPLRLGFAFAHSCYKLRPFVIFPYIDYCQCNSFYTTLLTFTNLTHSNYNPDYIGFAMSFRHSENSVIPWLHILFNSLNVSGPTSMKLIPHLVAEEKEVW